VHVTIIQPATIGTDWPNASRNSSYPSTPLWSSSMPNDSHATVSGEPPRPSRSPARSPTWSTVAACRCASRSGCAQNGCSPGSPRACWAGSSGRHTSGNARAAPHHTPHRDARRSQPTAATGGSGRSIRRSLRLIKNSSALVKAGPAGAVQDGHRRRCRCLQQGQLERSRQCDGPRLSLLREARFCLG
jgi:hypothetical protein